MSRSTFRVVGLSKKTQVHGIAQNINLNRKHDEK